MITHGDSEIERQPTIAGITPTSVSTAELRRLPLICGETETPAMWCGDIYDQFTEDAPDDGGKK